MAAATALSLVLVVVVVVVAAVVTTARAVGVVAQAPVIRLYSNQAQRYLGGNVLIGSRGATTTLCKSWTQYLSLGCVDGFALMGGFSTEAGWNYSQAVIPGTTTTFPDNIPVVGPAGASIAPSWGALLNGGATNNFVGGGVFSSGVAYWVRRKSTARRMRDELTLSWRETTSDGTAGYGWTCKQHDVLELGFVGVCR